MAKKEKELSPEEVAALEARRRAEQNLERAKRARERARLGGLWSRRDFLGRLSWVGFGGFAGISLLAAVRSAFPRVLFKPPSSFKAGFPGDYAVGEVSEKFKTAHRVWLVRNESGFYAIFAKCTHLGCTPLWLAAESKFKCPCHGSGYYKDGVNFEGPAPRPMDRARITTAEDGQLLVDVGVLYKYGTWEKPGAFLKA